jgi:cold-inducible RNA-binding protein
MARMIMSKRLFVGGLPYEMTDEKLQELFSQCGRVEKVKVMFDRATGRSKGFGFIEMATDLEGNAAILKFDGTTLGTRSISVKEAKPAENRPRPGGSNGPGDHRTIGPVKIVLRLAQAAIIAVRRRWFWRSTRPPP